MTSVSTYCVYLTTYRGNKLPPFYIGSSSTSKVEAGYHGSVKSKKYKDIWKSELKDNPHLFITRIVCTTETREQATAIEYRLQKSLNVVKSTMYINMAVAAPNGCYGMDVKGKYNPNFGKRHKFSDQSRKNMSISKLNRVMPKESIKKTVAAHVLSYKLYFPIEGTNKPDQKGQYKIVTNLNEFVRKYNSEFQTNKLDQGTMIKVAQGKLRHHKGFIVEYFTNP